MQHCVYILLLIILANNFWMDQLHNFREKFPCQKKKKKLTKKNPKKKKKKKKKEKRFSVHIAPSGLTYLVMKDVIST